MTKDTRRFKKLRISLTDTCNLACTYCVPENWGLNKHYKTAKQLTSKQILDIIKSLHKHCGLEKIRLTGGEPLLYLDIEYLIKGIKTMGIDDIGLTTNAYFLKALAPKLKKAGLNSINISLDALKEETFLKLTRKPELQKTLDGIDAAINQGFDIKINAVILKNINENQIIPLIHFGIAKNIPVRFLELMKMGYLHHNFNQYFVSQEHMLHTIKTHFNFNPINRQTSSTSNYWQLSDSDYQFGIIANESAPFCADCDRLRLDSYGNIFGCISAQKGIPILDEVNNNVPLTRILEKAKAQKQHHFIGSELSMRYLGG